MTSSKKHGPRRSSTKSGWIAGKFASFPFARTAAGCANNGPIFVKSKSGQVGCTCWRFNAWARYDDWKLDCLVAGKIAKTLSLPSWHPTRRAEPREGPDGGAGFQPALGRQNVCPTHPPAPHGARLAGSVVLEGGSIDVNGEGLLLTTEECLLSPIQARNPGLGREDLEKILADHLGISKVLWLGRGIAGDDTHGHVDDLARFVGPRTVVTVGERNQSDPNYLPLQDNLNRLKEMTDPDGRKLEVVELPMPEPVIFAGRRLPASYANFYISNARVLVPTFNDPADTRALSLLAELFPGRQVVGIHTLDLVWGRGTLHCITQQQPA